jgi:aryl-alcohol dehydrogenase-like predicted oxidoreductase
VKKEKTNSVLSTQTSALSQEGGTMKTKRMGRTGLKVSEICLGTMTFGRQCDETKSFAIMDTAVEHGVDFFDTADVYPVGGELELVGRTEEIVGRWLKGRREQIVLATKCWGAMSRRPNDRGLSRKHIFRAIEGSLHRLQTDYLDLYQVHLPDLDTPLDETLRALDDLVHQGKVRYLGCSNFQAWLLACALWTSDKYGLARFDCVQPRYNLLFREIENELLPLCRYQGIGVIPYNPLAGGFLTGKHKPSPEPTPGTRFALSGRTGVNYRQRYWHEAQFAAVSQLQEFFAAHNKPLTQVAVAWVLAQPDITSPIVGATSPEQLRQSLAATELTLDEEEMEVCNEVWFTLPRPSDPTVALR